MYAINITGSNLPNELEVLLKDKINSFDFDLLDVAYLEGDKSEPGLVLNQVGQIEIGTKAFREASFLREETLETLIYYSKVNGVVIDYEYQIAGIEIGESLEQKLAYTTQ